MFMRLRGMLLWKEVEMLHKDIGECNCIHLLKFYTFEGLALECFHFLPRYTSNSSTFLKQVLYFSPTTLFTRSSIFSSQVGSSTVGIPWVHIRNFKTQDLFIWLLGTA